MRLFYGLCALLDMIILNGDVDNAYQNSPSPTEPCYLEADEAYRSWYRKRFNKVIDWRTHVIPALRAIQGHPEAGRLFEDFIVKILQSPPLNFTSTTHERNLGHVHRRGYLGTGLRPLPVPDWLNFVR
jgi:hypothetical protein